MANEYMQMLADSLVKKSEILSELIDKTNTQRDVVSAPEVDWDAFDQIVEAKGNFVEELVKLDDGFDVLYARIKDELTANKAAYKTEIGAMQALIKEVTDKSTELQAMEHRNKALIEQRFAESKQAIKQSKMGSKAAMEYYQRMNNLKNIDPHLMDKKR